MKSETYFMLILGLLCVFFSIKDMIKMRRNDRRSEFDYYWVYPRIIGVFTLGCFSLVFAFDSMFN
ncbi:MAG: hypothetical protein CME70_00340 [Halobacteriovorax sp.]|nr:hypothetical protein [Halobacteriovorax sp.]